MTTKKAGAVVQQAGEGERFWFAGGGIWTMKASAAQTGGAFTLFEDSMVRGKATPLHLHPNEDETFYVLEGELTFQLRDELLTARPGSIVFAPRDVPHTLANRTDAPARYLLVCTPGGFERYFDRIAAEIEGVEPPPGSGPQWEVIRVGPQIGERG
jgi:quercetin dioxygenase-like cupin family protein